MNPLKRSCPLVEIESPEHKRFKQDLDATPKIETSDEETSSEEKSDQIFMSSVENVLPRGHKCSHYDLKQPKDQEKVFKSLNRCLQKAIKFAKEETPKKLFEYFDIEQENLEVGNAYLASSKGKRELMEDAACAFTFTFSLGKEEVSANVYALFDGHGMSTFYGEYQQVYQGLSCSTYHQHNLKRVLKKSLQEFCKEGLDHEVFNAIQTAFLALDEEYRQYCLDNDPELDTSCLGTTTAMAMIVNKKLWVSNAGDSRVFVTNKNSFFPLTYDAKPSELGLKLSILKRGGIVKKNRVIAPNAYGKKGTTLSLAVARAAGNYFLAKNKEKVISARPKITCLDLNEVSEPGTFLILACDGVFDVATTKEVSNYVNTLYEHGKNTKQIAKNIVKKALDAKSQDNITAIVVPILEVNPV